MRVTLHLFPGAHIEINGAPVTAADLPLETSGELAFVSDAGETLWLQPPQAYEEGDPTAHVAGSYRLLPGTNESSLELATRIPYEWLAAVERQYPVVLDPVFQILPSAENLVRNATYVNGVFSEWGPLNPTSLRLGHRWTHSGTIVDRLFARFPLPSLPPGETTITAATLEVWPTGVGWDEERVAKNATVEVSLYTANAGWWLATPPANASNLGVQQGTPHTLYYSDGAPRNVLQWNVLPLVRDGWFANPSANYGIVLAVTNESCVPCPIDHDYCTVNVNCTGFDFAARPALNETLTGFAEGSGGMRLIVTYTGPTLDEGETISCTSPLCSNPAAADNYYNAAHEYIVQGLSSAPYYWQAIVARGMGEFFGNCPTPDAENMLCGQNLDGMVALDLRNTQDAVRVKKEETANGALSYVLLNRRANAAAVYHTWVNPNATKAPVNGYDIRLVRESTAYQIAIDTTTVITADFDTNDPLALRHIVLPANAHNRVDIEILSHNHRDGNGDPVAGTYDYAKNFTMQLLPSSAAYIGVGTRSVKPTTVTPQTSPLPYGAARLQIGPFDTTTSAGYALALAYGGPALSIYTCDGSYCGPTQMAPQAEWKVLPLEFTYRVRVTACSGNKFPTRDGTCQEVRCPTSSSFPPGDPANERRTVGGLELWSEDGWTGTTANTGVAPLIGPAEVSGVADAPTVAVVGGTLSYDQTGPNGIASLNADVLLITCGDPANATNPLGSTFAVYRGAMKSDGVALLPTPNSFAWGNTDFNPWENDQGILSNAFLVNPIQGRVEDTVAVRRQTGVALDFRVEYWANATGWPSLASAVYQTDADDPPPVAGVLNLDLGNSFSMDTQASDCNPRKFVAIRALNATVTQPANMGGASQSVRMTIVAAGQYVAGQPCADDGDNCIDVLAPDDVYSDNGLPNRNWRMPDIHIDSGLGTVMLSMPGKLHVWSADHPAAVNQPEAYAQNFSFDTFGGEVSIEEGACGDIPSTTIIKGKTQVTLPMIGDGASGDSMIAVGFTLCGDPNAALRQMTFEFKSPVGIPIGSTGLFANGLKGTVDISPSDTEISFDMDCYYGDPSTFQGHGSVTISTAGIFTFQGSGKILGVVDGDGKLWVGWDPLDTGFEVGFFYQLGDVASIDGTVRAHAWQGQGWQHRYPWLPDNDEEHFTAQIASTFTLYDGALIDAWPLVIPPVELSRSLDIAFGQFCTNSSCASYEWGIKAALEVCGYHAGVYYGFDHGVSVILGNDNHTLIDQYGSPAIFTAAASQPADEGAEMKMLAAPQAINGVVSLPVTVTANTEELLLGLGWQAGTLALSLYEPDGDLVFPNPAYAIYISNTTQLNDGITTYNRLMGVKLLQPGAAMAGIWHAQISGITPESHYKFVFLASKGAPGTPANRGSFTAPASSDVNGSGSYTIKWEVANDAPISTTINLYYTGYYETDPGYYMPFVTDMPIVQHLNYHTGQYVWNTASLKSLDSFGVHYLYRIRAIVDDGVNDFPAGAVCDSGDFCKSCDNIPSEYAFDSRRFPGVSTFSSVGRIWVNDTTAPSAPTGLDVTGISGALLARWNPNPTSEKDLAAYVVQWGRVTCPPLGSCVWDGGAPAHAERVAPVMTPTLRIGGVTTAGLILGQSYGVVVRAVDINGNTSAASAMDIARPTDDAAAQIPAAPITPTLLSATSNSATIVAGSYHTSGAPAYFRVRYREAATFSTPIQIDHIAPTTVLPDMSLFTVNLPNLQTGATYEVWATAANSNDWHSASSPPLTFTASNGTDGDSDGMPDDWETTYQIGLATLDADRDGLNNLNEYRNGTQPWEQDSDDDGFSDGEEVISHTNPLDDAYYPAGFTLPRLRLARHRVNFYFKKGASYQAFQDVNFYNDGGGTLALSATDTAQWLNINVSSDGNYVRLFADAVLLTPGVYDTIVQVYQTSGPYFGERQCIRVRLHMLPADDDFPRQHIYLPLVMRNYVPPQWQSVLVDYDGDRGQHNALALDPGGGSPHISYYDATNGNLRLVDYVGTGGTCGPNHDWRCGDVKSTDDVGQYSSVAIWQGSVWKVGISYYNATSASLEYAEFIKAGDWTWTFTVVDAGNAAFSLRDGLYSSLKFDAAGNPHIAYYTRNPLGADALKYAHYVGGSAGNCTDTAWECSTIQSGEGVGLHAALDLDDTDRPHIAYYDTTNNLLRYAHYVASGGNCGPGNAWQCDTIESVVAPNSSDHLIALRAVSGTDVRIAYSAVDSATPTLKYASSTPGACGPGNSWKCILIASNVEGLALAATSNMTRIAYHNVSTGRLMLARPTLLGELGSCGPTIGPVRTWKCSILDDGDGGARDVGAFPSIALKSDGLAIIAYYDATNKDLWVALQQY